MIRLLKEDDLAGAARIVNDNWRQVYRGYVNEFLLSDRGCEERAKLIASEFFEKKLTHYVWDKNGKPAALLTLGDTLDDDKKGAFEIFRLYVAKQAQNQGIGSRLIRFAMEEAARKKYRETLLWAFEKNVRAALFYEKHGFVKDKKLELGEPYFARSVRFCRKV